MIETILNEVKKHWTVTERDTGAYHTLKKSGMKFIISAYRLEDFGSMSVINMSGMAGLMKMETVVLTAEEKDLPLFSSDFIKAMGNCTLLVEFYDTMVSPLDPKSVERYRAVKAKYQSLPPYETGSHWYDSIRYDFTLGAKDKSLNDLQYKIIADYLAAYLENAAAAPDVNPKVKIARTKSYVDGLFANGGPAVNQFIKLFGEATARDIFENYVFSCGER